MVEITAAEAVDRVASGARLIDVREQDEWNGGHAPTAVLIPTSEIQSRWQEIAADDEPAIIVCHSGYRSAMVADALERAGVPAVSLAGGMVEWAAAGGPVVTGRSHEGSDTSAASSGRDGSAAPGGAVSEPDTRS